LEGERVDVRRVVFSRLTCDHLYSLIKAMEDYP